MSGTTDTIDTSDRVTNVGTPHEAYLSESNIPYLHVRSRFMLDHKPRKLELIATYASALEKTEDSPVKSRPLIVTLVEIAGKQRYDDRYHFNGNGLECRHHGWRNLEVIGERAYFESDEPFEREGGNNVQKLLQYGALIAKMMPEDKALNKYFKGHPVIEALSSNTLRSNPLHPLAFELTAASTEKTNLMGASFENTCNYDFPPGPGSQRRNLSIKMVKSRKDEDDLLATLSFPLTILLTERFDCPECHNPLEYSDAYIFDQGGNSIFHKYFGSRPFKFARGPHSNVILASGEDGNFTKLLEYADPIQRMIGDPKRPMDSTFADDPIVTALRERTLNQLNIF